MTPPAPRRLLLIASPTASGRDAALPVRRYRLGRVLMSSEQLIGDRGATPARADGRLEGDGRWPA